MVNFQPIKPKAHSYVLSADQVAEIRAGTLHILKTVGVHFPSEQALHVFAEHGARVDKESQVVRLSPELVIEAMNCAPRIFTHSGRTESTDLVLDGTTSFFSTDGSGTEKIDLKTGEACGSIEANVAMMARLADYLSSISFFWPIVSAQDYGCVRATRFGLRHDW